MSQEKRPFVDLLADALRGTESAEERDFGMEMEEKTKEEIECVFEMLLKMKNAEDIFLCDGGGMRLAAEVLFSIASRKEAFGANTMHFMLSFLPFLIWEWLVGRRGDSQESDGLTDEIETCLVSISNWFGACECPSKVFHVPFDKTRRERCQVGPWQKISLESEVASHKVGRILRVLFSTLQRHVAELSGTVLLGMLFLVERIAAGGMEFDGEETLSIQKMIARMDGDKGRAIYSRFYGRRGFGSIFLDETTLLALARLLETARPRQDTLCLLVRRQLIRRAEYQMYPLGRIALME
eukprot:GHVN01003758.1.p1 GENE.GHVN01003758.1~~GHVN01003758.1.p1  ORF type:complete len:296 (+),score=36.15 GHVN01003758.1:756-1643(+)